MPVNNFKSVKLPLDKTETIIIFLFLSIIFAKTEFYTKYYHINRVFEN